jgi:hypothetical protein
MALRGLFTLSLRFIASHGQPRALNSSMASIFKRFRGLLLLLMLASLSLRALTGAAEVQVNFTSIIVEQYKSVGSDVDKESMLRGVVASNPADASSIPDNLKTFATYKKYLTPESAIQLPINPPQIPLEAIDIDGNLVNSYSREVIFRPTSHSPPAVVPAHLHTHSTSAVKSANLENYIGEIAINNSIGGIGCL